MTTRPARPAKPIRHRRNVYVPIQCGSLSWVRRATAQQYLTVGAAGSTGRKSVLSNKGIVDDQRSKKGRRKHTWTRVGALLAVEDRSGSTGLLGAAGVKLSPDAPDAGVRGRATTLRRSTVGVGSRAERVLSQGIAENNSPVPGERISNPSIRLSRLQVATE